MTEGPDEQQERRVARAAARRGFKVQRSHDWDPGLADDGTYVLVHIWTNGAVAGPGLSLDELEHVLDEG
ncbi:MAG TPA: hypothetical protein VM844_04635 [Miltoncostaeaceae bacterium]|jgi:hypothetical protein|nr:hypothetical protein [Miltoncostaeaceae bacterium]